MGKEEGACVTLASRESSGSAVCKKGMQHSLTVACTCVIDHSCLIAYACVNVRFCICKWTDKIAYVKEKNVTENGVCMLSLSRVNKSYMCLNMSPPKDFSGNFLVLHIGIRPSSVHGA